MLGWLTLILCCQLAGELARLATGLPVPGPVIGMVLLFAGLMIKGAVPDGLGKVADGLLAAVEAGASAVIQPGGSIRDDEVIAAADEAGLAMVFTGMRHFRH